MKVVPMGCPHLVPAFIALNTLKMSDSLCKVIGSLAGFHAVCGSKDFSDELDRRALCELFCCCQEGGRQRCVADVLKQADAFRGYKGYYKQEVPYKDRAPVMSRNEPERATRSRPAGSRIPDVVVVKDAFKPPTLDNIQKVYEMKFPGDTYSSEIGPDDMTQSEAYRKLFEGKIDKEAMDAESCGCKEGDKDSVLQKASAWMAERERAISLVDRTNADTAKAVGALAGATVLGRAAEVAGAVLGTIVRAMGLAF